MKYWTEVKAQFEQAPEDWSIYIEAFDRFGCPETLQEDTPPSLSAYFVQVDGVEQRIEGLVDELKHLGATKVALANVPEQDWSETWKQFFKTRRVGKRIMIVPTWENYEPKIEDIVVTLDPGQAFGTGDHPTTRLCLEQLEKAGVAGKSVADIGCGSGILSIAAVKLGAIKVVATDIDEQSVQITKDNALLNQVAFETASASGFDALTEPVDIVLSNIISATLIRLAPDAARAIKPGGIWIISGVIEQNWQDVKRSAESAGFTFVTMAHEDDWVGATFRR